MDGPPPADPVARAAGLAEAVAAAADEIERTQRVPPALLDRLHEARLYRLLLPASCGGEEIAPDLYMRAVEAVSRGDASVGWNMFVANSSALIAPFVPAGVAAEIFADPRAIISWGPPNRHVATAVAGGYRISGRWDFASGCRQATWMGAHAQVVEPDGSLRLNAAGRPTVRTLLFPAESATLLDTWNAAGLRGTASDSYRLDDLFVPEAYSGTREDPTLRREPGPLYAFPMQGLYAVGVAGVAMGIAGAMLDAFVALAGDKTPRGLGRLADSATVQALVARATARLASARALLLLTLREIHATAGADAPIAVADRARVRLATTHAIHESVAVADLVHHAAGVDAIFPGSPFERRFRDLHTLASQIQGRTAHYEAVGRVLLGDPPEDFL